MVVAFVVRAYWTLRVQSPTTAVYSDMVATSRARRCSSPARRRLSLGSWRCGPGARTPSSPSSSPPSDGTAGCRSGLCMPSSARSWRRARAAHRPVRPLSAGGLPRPGCSSRSGTRTSCTRLLLLGDLVRERAHGVLAAPGPPLRGALRRARRRHSSRHRVLLSPADPGDVRDRGCGTRDGVASSRLRPGAPACCAPWFPSCCPSSLRWA